MGRDSNSETNISAVVGLGNPGKEYEATRHNLGFQVIELLAQYFNSVLQERKFRAMWGGLEIGKRKVYLIKPLAFMNRSGEPVGEFLRYFGIPANRMLVIHDDLDLATGRLKIVRQGGAGGHRGIQSIIQQLHSEEFPRLKLGIGRPARGEGVEGYVLGKPYPEDLPILIQMIDRAVRAVEAVLLSGLDNAMNKFNQSGADGELDESSPRR